MATKKTAAAVEEIQEEPVQPAEEPAAQKSEWDEKISMIVPRKPRGEEQSYYVCVNDRRFLIPANGQMQELPKPVALVLQDSLTAEVEADDFAENMPQMF